MAILSKSLSTGDETDDSVAYIWQMFELSVVDYRQIF